MHVIDRYAYTNQIRTVDPAQKGGLAFLTLLLCLLLSRPLVSIMAITWMVALAVGWARLPLRAYIRVLLAESFFLLLSTLGVALSGGIGPAPTLMWHIQIESIWIGSSPAALADAFRLIMRALGCAAALNFLILTTPLVDMIDLLRRLRLPELVIDLMTVIYTSIFVLLESMQRMYTAQHSRLGYRNARRTLASAALLGTRLFIDAYHRSQGMQMALESRGYSGHLRVLPLQYTRDRRTWWFALGIAVSLTLAWSSL